MKKQLLILTMLCISIIGYSQTVGDTFMEGLTTYEVTSVSPNTVKITDFTHGSVDAVILATVTNNTTTYNVTSIGNDAFNYSGPSANRLDSVTFTLPSNITTIGNTAFRSQDLTTVTIPSSVISIGDYAFWSNDLTSITFENGIETIGAYTFSANNITDVIIPNSVTSIGIDAFQNNQITSVTLSNNLTTIGSGAFRQNLLQSIVIPNSVTSFSSAFSYNQLTSVILPNGLTEIGISAFRSNNLTHVTIPSTVTNIGNTAFRDNPLATVTSQATTPPTIFTPGINDSFWNRSVIDVTIPSGTSSAYAAGGWTGFNSVTEATPLAVGDTFIVDYITYEVTSVTPDSVEAIDYDVAGGTVVDIPSTVPYSVTTYNVTSIGFAAFNDKQLTNVSIGDNVTLIGQAAFFDNIIDTVIIGNNVTDIGFGAFQSNQLTNVILPNSVTTLENQVFSQNQLTDVTIGTGITTIPNLAFSSNQFTSFTIPNHVTIIGDRVFDGCYALSDVTIGSNVTSIGTLAFRYCQLANVISLSTTPPTITTGGGMETFKADRSNINLILTGNTTDEYVTDNGAQWTGFKMVFEATSATTAKVTDYEAANGTVVNIPAAVTVPSVTVFNVTEIGISAFANKSLTDVTIPNSVITIGTSAFETNSLTSVTIPDSVINIGQSAFSFNSITNVVIGANVDQIGIGAFVNNNLTDITIPSNVTSIGLLAFGNNPLLANVTSLATVPPTITTGTNDTFIFDRSNTALHIPAGTLAAYVTDTGALWTGFNPVTEDALSISDFEFDNNIKIFTTPEAIKVIASNNIRLENYTLYSISGAKITSGKETEIKTTSFANGIYILKLNFDKGTVTKKIVIN